MISKLVLQQVVIQYGYSISDIRDFDQLADLGGNRFLGENNRLLEKNSGWYNWLQLFFKSVSALVIDALVGPDPENRYSLEHNDDLQQNPNGSSFESLHHLFCNISQVPVSILISTGN